MKLKADLHAHCSDDPMDFITYTADELFAMASSFGYNVMAITLHEKWYDPDIYREKARQYGITLIPGVELRIEGSDVLAYNITKVESVSIGKLADIAKIRRDDTLIIAPHPYVPFVNSLGRKLDSYHHLFDAIEVTSIHSSLLSYWNDLARKRAAAYKLPLVGNGDIHELWQLEHTYSLITAEKDAASVIQAIKNGKVEVVSRPLPMFRLLLFPVRMIADVLRRTFRKF
ncbi:TPA: hypothetical protein HA361_00685 [Candidatus Woesearchaeota archaeon]|nr:hypothetical protein [Candidatus Woesearchaeota archaeon]HII69497.1 hypothetical protein [Candidatus Woesearchaeota archaeon]